MGAKGSLSEELARARQREAAAREILELINQSRHDEAPVFDAILRRAADLCSAHAAALVMGKEGDTHQRMVASDGVDPASVALYASGGVPMNPEISFAARAILTGEVVHVEDMMDTARYRSGDGLVFATGRDSGIRTIMYVPLVTERGGIGALNIFRREVRPYTVDEITLVETFAAQAVIAIENVRQFRELRDSLEQQEATSDILRVISQSREDEAQVFDLVLDKATVLCGADQGSLFIVNEARTHIRLLADWGHDRTAYRPGLEFSLDLPLSLVATIRSGKVVHIEDYAQSDAYRDREPIAVELVEIEGVRTRLNVPLLQNGIAIGCISLSRRVVRAFTLAEIQLVETFAAQAVIAIENVRQFRELQTRLEREAATRDILEVISQSRDDDAPVFDAILRSAARLCSSPMAWLLLADDARTTLTLAGYHGDNRRTIEIGDEWPLDPDADPQTGLGGVHDDGVLRAILEARTIQDEDMALTPHYLAGDATMRRLVDEEGLRTRLSVPLVSGGEGIGVIVLSRREAAPFGPEDIALLDTFAEQAVIAIENVRQFRAIQTANAELETRLAREAATREILEVISQSRDDDRPVFDAVLRNSAILCGASMASLDIMSDDRSHAVLVAHWGDSNAKLIPVGTTIWPMDSDLAPPTSMREGRVVHIHDMADTDLYRSGEPLRVAAVDMEGIRTFLAVPLFSGGRTVGCIEIYRREVRPFSDDEIALVETFAAQAVIAIENVRQFRELQTRLERERASAEILEVISKSRDDEAPVFEVILQNMARLCSTSLATLNRVNAAGTHLEYAAHWGAAFKTFDLGNDRWPLDSTLQIAQSVRERRVIHTPDLVETDPYRQNDPIRVRLVEVEGVRSYLTVPLITATREVIGCLGLYRQGLRPFAPDEIALIETFAAQAVIAIENVRQFKALEALNAELGDRVQEQVGEIERMGRLKRFLPAAVADTVISSGSEKLLSSHRALLGVLFCDIRGFTAFCETAEPEETIEVLQTYHEEMGKLINAHGAGVDHRIGDGIMVLFNDPLPCDDPAGTAVRLALAMRDRMADLCAGWKRMGHRLGFGVGISLGYATVGMVGSGGRFDYTASGTAINLASRLADEAQDGEILLSPRARTAVEDRFPVEPRGEFTLKGIREPVEVFRLARIDSA